MNTATHVLWQSILRTIIPVAVGGILGWFASAGIEADPELESALGAAFTAAGTAIYYVIARVLEVHVSPKFGWLLGLAKSPDGYSEGPPPVGQGCAACRYAHPRRRASGQNLTPVHHPARPSIRSPMFFTKTSVEMHSTGKSVV